MKIKLLSLALIVTFIACQNYTDLEHVNNIELRLETFDYFEEAIPNSMKTSYGQDLNHDEIAALGRLLFYDTRLSQNNSIACANCHQQNKGFADDKAFSNGLRNHKTTRNAMTLVNNASQISHFWEGRDGIIDDHILSPVSNHIEMGMKNTEELVEKLSEIEAYNRLFNHVYGKPINGKLITKSLSTFIASIVSYNSKFDKGATSNYTNFTNAERTGKALFFGKAKCGRCHQGDNYAASWRKYANIGLAMQYEDQGAGEGRFKVPSLRNIALTGPYMHDGRFETLEEVVNHYTDGIENHPFLDSELRQGKIELTEVEKGQLIDFLHTLTDYQLISDEKFSNPFQ